MTRGETIAAVLYGLTFLSLMGVMVENKLKRIIEILERNRN